MPRKKYNPRKFADKVQTFTYELRVWANATDEGPIEESHAFAFPVENTRLKADRYAFNFGVVAWAFVTFGVVETPAIETAEKVEAILDEDGIAALIELRSKLTAPCYGQLVRHPTRISFGTKMAEYGTVQDGRYRETFATTAADRVIDRLSA